MYIPDKKFIKSNLFDIDYTLLEVIKSKALKTEEFKNVFNEKSTISK